MADAQIAIIDGDQTQVVLAPGENPAIVSSIPGPQGPAGAGVPLGGTTNQVLFKQSGTNYDTAWGPITSAMIGDLEIVNADVSASAAIAGTKISPNFGSQNVVTTGTSTAASFIPSSSTVPTNGLYLSAANSVALSTNGTGRLLIDSSGNLIQYSTTTLERQHRQQASSAYTATNIKSVLDGAAGYLTFDTGTNWTNGNAVERLRITSTGQLSHIGAGSSGSPAVSFSGSAASNSLVVDSSSRVGIGTSSPGSILDLGSGSTGRSISWHSNASVSYGNIWTAQGSGAVVLAHSLKGSTSVTDGFESSVGISRARSALELKNGTITLFTDPATTVAYGASFTPTPRLSIDSSGRVGIGTTSPLGILDLTGTSRIVADVSGATPKLTGLNAAASAQVELALDGSALVFRTLGAEKARIDSSGRLLVGTASARSQGGVTTRLQVENTTYDGLALIVNSPGAANCPVLLMGKSRGGTLNSSTLVDNGDRLAALYVQGADGTDIESTAAAIEVFVDGTPGANDMPGRLVFSTTADGAASPTERMRISNGGATSVFGANDVFSAMTSQAAGTTYATFIGRHTATSTTTGTLSYVVWSNGNVVNSNNSYGSLSDLKLKENIVDASSQWDDLKALQVRNFNFKEGQTHKQIGLIAQEVEPISPGLVYESPDRDEDGNDLGTVTKSVNYSVLYMKAVKALQEAMERIETLEAKVAALEA